MRRDDTGIAEGINSVVSDDLECIKDAVDGESGSERLKKLVHTYYRSKGLQNEPVVRTAMGRFDIYWRQNMDTFDVWFPCLSAKDLHSDYTVQFMPQKVTITYKSDALAIPLRGKVDVDGCFWSMQELPDVGKVVGMVLRKRKPAYSGTWEHLFRAIPTARTET